MGATIAKLIEILKEEGFNVTETIEWTQECDGSISLGTKWDVQVGDGYFVINQEVEEGYLHRGEASSVPELMQLLRKFKSEIY